MKTIIRDATGTCLAPSGSVVCIGAFDGLHRGHQELLRLARARASALQVPLIAMSFDPLPREFFARDAKPGRLSSPSMKISQLRAAGADVVVLLRFNAAMAQTSAESFVEHMLVERCHPRAVLVGEGFRFGHRRLGGVSMLRSMLESRAIEVQTIAPVILDEEAISSSRVRHALANGELTQAARLLGRAYRMGGRVVHGAQLGRTLGFPTANLRVWNQPALQGIFAVRVHGIGATPRDAVASLGTRPTVNGRECLLESFVFDFDGDLYGQRLEVEFVQKLRDELKFDSLDALKIQMQRDADQARQVLQKPQWS